MGIDIAQKHQKEMFFDLSQSLEILAYWDLNDITSQIVGGSDIITNSKLLSFHNVLEEKNELIVDFNSVYN